MSFFENTRRPEGFGGKLMVSMMNLGHGALAEWGLQHLAVPEGAAVLDCGCGGGGGQAGGRDKRREWGRAALVCRLG